LTIHPNRPSLFKNKAQLLLVRGRSGNLFPALLQGRLLVPALFEMYPVVLQARLVRGKLRLALLLQYPQPVSKGRHELVITIPPRKHQSHERTTARNDENLRGKDTSGDLLSLLDAVCRVRLVLLANDKRRVHGLTLGRDDLGGSVQGRRGGVGVGHFRRGHKEYRGDTREGNRMSRTLLRAARPVGG